MSPVINISRGGVAITPPVSDPFFANNVLLTHMDADPPQDESNSAHTLTVSGAVRDTTIKKFGSSSFDIRNSTDYIEAADSDDWHLASEIESPTEPVDFTAEFWGYFKTAVGSGDDRMFLSHNKASNADRSWLWYMLNRTLFFEISSTGNSQVPGGIFAGYSWTAVNSGQWYHHAVTREGDTWRMFLDGVKIQEATESAIPFNATTEFRIGRDVQGSIGGRAMNIDEIRIKSGIALYTANFTPPDAPHPDI